MALNNNFLKPIITEVKDIFLSCRPVIGKPLEETYDVVRAFITAHACSFPNRAITPVWKTGWLQCLKLRMFASVHCDLCG